MRANNRRSALGPPVETSIGWLTLALAGALPLYHPWTGAAVILMAVVWLFGPGLRGRLARVQGDRLSVAVTAFFALNLLSLIWSSDRAAGLADMDTMWYLLTVPILATTVPNGFRRPALIVFEVAALAAAALSFTVHFGLIAPGLSHPENPSPTMHHIDFSLLLALASLNALAYGLLAETEIRRRWPWLGCWLVLTAALFTNIGRSGHLAFLGSLAVLAMWWLRGRKPRHALVAAAALGATLATIWFASPTLRERVSAGHEELRAAVTEDRFHTSVGSRVAAMKVAGTMFAERPLLGYGAGGAMPEFRSRLQDEDPELAFAVGWYPHLHSQYAQTATELGIVGLGVLAWIFWELLRRGRERSEAGALAVVLGAAYLIGFVAEPFFHKQLTLVLFAFSAAVIASPSKEPPVHSPRAN